MAHECPDPAATLTAPTKFLAVTGAFRAWLVESPSSPFTFRPQHATSPPETVAQVWLPPAARVGGAGVVTSADAGLEAVTRPSKLAIKAR